MSPSPSVSWLSRWEKCGLGLLLAVVVVFGGLVELRSAFLSRRMGDLGVYLRTAWAVRAGDDLYTIADNNQWHFNYPPLLAILLVPLADPPADIEASWVVPYHVSVLVWYVVNMLCVMFSLHWLASALEQSSQDPAVRSLPAGCRRWWWLRILPFLACLTPIGHTLMRGQINLVTLALLSGMAAALMRGRSLLAGFCLAGATCVKVIPGFLIVYALWKRDLRCLAGLGMGMLAGLVLIPGVVFGPARTLECYRTWQQVLVEPALVGGPDESRARELLMSSATCSQSLVSTLHIALHPDPETRPSYPASWLRVVCWGVGALLTVMTFYQARRRCSGSDVVLVLGALTMIMLLLSPVCHRHYFCLQLPLVLALTARAWEGMGRLGIAPGLTLVLLVNLLANSVSHLPGCETLRDLGLGTGAALLLWLTAMLQLRRDARPRRQPYRAAAPVPALAA